jgi:hypothetical protein
LVYWPVARLFILRNNTTQKERKWTLIHTPNGVRTRDHCDWAVRDRMCLPLRSFKIVSS